MLELDLTDLCRVVAARLEARYAGLSAERAYKATELAAQAAMGDEQARAEVRALRSPVAQELVSHAHDLLKLESAYWIAKLALEAHLRPLPPRHPSAGFVSRAFQVGYARPGGGGARPGGGGARPGGGGVQHDPRRPRYDGWRTPPAEDTDRRAEPCCGSCGLGLACEGTPVCRSLDAPRGWPGHELEGVPSGGRG